MAFDYKKEYREFYMPPSQARYHYRAKHELHSRSRTGRPECRGGRIQTVDRAFVWNRVYHQNEPKRRSSDRRVFRLCRAAARRLLVAGWRKRDRLCPKGKLQVDIGHPSSGLCDKSRFEWAIREATKKKKTDFAKVEFLSCDEGLCVQCMHVGSYDDEPVTVALMHEYMKSRGYVLDITDKRMHHEIYLSDARKVAPEKRRTVIRHPIRKMEE